MADVRVTLAYLELPDDETDSQPQLARPSSDVAAGAWLPNVPGSPTELFAMLDESSPDDADYIYTKSNSLAKIKLASVGDPYSSAGHICRYRCRVAAGTLHVRLMQGDTEIVEWTHNNAAAPSFTTFQQTLTEVQAAVITDYTDLELQFELQGA